MNFQCTCNFGLKYPVDFLPAIHPLEWELSLHVSTELNWDCAWKCIIMRFVLKMWKPSTQQFTVYPLTVHIWVMGWLILCTKCDIQSPSSTPVTSPASNPTSQSVPSFQSGLDGIGGFDMLGNSGIFYTLAVFYAQLYDFQTVSFYFSVRLDAFKYLLLLFFFEDV